MEKIIIDCISDLHGYYPKLEGGDILIVAGDLTARDTPDQFDEFFSWLSMQNYKKAVFIAGNHDNLLQKGCVPFLELDKPYDISIDYLCDSGTEFEGLKIWGSPWTLNFPGMNPHCKAFTVDTEEELAEKWKLIPEDTDILITHSPPYGILDKTIDGIEAGSSSMHDVFCAPNKNYLFKLHVFGHIHEAYGKSNLGKRVNASLVNEYYQPVNKPIRVIL